MRSFVLTLLAALLPALAVGGEGDLAWAKRAGGLDAEHGKAIVGLPDGSLVVAGDFGGVSTFGPGEVGETELTSAGGVDVFVARYTAGGSLIWAKNAGGVSNDYATAAGVLADGTVVVAGYFSGTATFGKGEAGETALTSAGSYDLFVARYNSDGTLAWAKRAGGQYADEAHGITVFADSSLAITGSFQGTAVFGKDEPGEASLVSASLRDVFVAKYNSDGTLDSAWRAGGADWDYGVAIAGFADGSTAITGNFQGTATFGKDEPGETVLTSAGIPDVFVARFNPDGTLAWAKRAGGDRHDYGRGIVALSDGTVVVSGSFLNTATFGPGEAGETQLTSVGFSDVFMARYNVDGTLAWAKRAGGTDWDYAEGLALLSGDVVAATGYFKGSIRFGSGEPGRTDLVSGGNYDVFAARYNPDGTLASAVRSGGTGEDRGYGLAVGQSGSLLATGWFEETATFGPGELGETQLTAAGGADVFLTGSYGGAGTLLYVDADATGGNNGLSWTDAFADLQDALAFAEDGYEIWVAEGTYNPTAGGERTARFTLKSGVPLYGGFDGAEALRSERDPIANVTILSGDIGTPGDSSDNSYHVVRGTDGGTLDGFTVTEGNANGVNGTNNNYGGGMYNSGVSPTVTGCTFSNNLTSYGGGGMYNRGGSAPTVTGCSFTGNVSTYHGGGMYNDASSPQVASCTFSGNKSGGNGNGYNGGGVYNVNSSPTFAGCTFSGNQAGKGAGMANVSGSSGTLTGCEFSGNTAADKGGGVYNNSSSPGISGCTFSGNSGKSGGGVYSYSSSPQLTSCTFSSNTVTQFGGGMYNDSSSGPAVLQCVFRGNIAGYYGGGMCNKDSSPAVTSCTFWGNTAGRGGGMGSYGTSGATVKNGILWGNTATLGTGNGIYNGAGATTTATYSCVQDGYAGTGNINQDPLFVDAAGGDFHLKSRNGHWSEAGWVKDEESSPGIDMGDAAYDYSNEPEDNGDRVNMGTFGNTAQASKSVAGLVIYVDADAAGANNGLSWADAYTDLQSALSVGINGNEIWVAEGTYNPTAGGERTARFTLKSGVPLYGGFDGAEALRSERDPVANVTILSGDIGTPGDSSDNSYHVVRGADGGTLDGFTVTEGNANGVSGTTNNYGGGMYNSGVSPTVTGCTFSNNLTSYGGGGMYNRGGSAPTVTDCSFTGNVSTYHGGGMYNDASSPQVANCAFSGNKSGGNGSSYNGGGVYSTNSSPTFTSCAFSSNQAGKGGGMACVGGTAGTVTGGFYGNSAAVGGGGIYCNGSSPAISNSTFAGNSGKSGGGMYNYASSPQLTDCIFAGNTVTQFGAGMYNVSASAPAVLRCRFNQNVAAYYGGGVCNKDSSPVVTNCTFWGNTAGRGGGMGSYGTSGATVKNGILWGNTATLGTGPGIYNGTGSSTTASYSCVQGGYAGTGNIDLDPLFVDPAGTHDFHLKSQAGHWTAGGWVVDGVTSPCLDVGDPADAYGNEPTPHGDRINMGAYGNTAQASKSTLAHVIFVDAGATGANNGTSWTNAYTDLQSALAAATSGKDIWVAQGTYKPTAGADRTISFQLKSEVAVYAGFDATETSRDQRTWSQNVTTLSGDIGTPGDSSDNTYHVLVGVTGGTLDGFTISGGMADGAAGYDSGGGMYNSSASPTVANCRFTTNSADQFGGGMRNDSSSPTVTNCVFNGNVANNKNGGGMSNVGSSTTVSNCTFENNTGDRGGGISNSGGSPAIKNCILWGNTSVKAQGNGIYDTAGATPTVTYSCVQDGYAGVGNIDQDPLFVNAGSGDYHLQSEAGRWTAGGWVVDGVTSQCIDAGDPADGYSNEPEDNDDRINMGAYGNTAQASKSFTPAAPGAEENAMEDSEELVVPPATVAEPVPEVF